MSQSVEQKQSKKVSSRICQAIGELITFEYEYSAQFWRVEELLADLNNPRDLFIYYLFFQKGWFLCQPFPVQSKLL